MARNYSNIATETVLTGGINDTIDTLTVSSAAGYPAVDFSIIVDTGGNQEVMLVTGASGTTFTVTRGYNGSTAVAHSAGAAVYHGAIADDFTLIRQMDTGVNDLANHTIYVAKHGSNSNHGRSILYPMLTITAAIAAAATLTPSNTNRIMVHILDAGIYAESATTASYVDIYGPAATVQGFVNIADTSAVRLMEVRDTVGYTLVRKTTGTGNSYAYIDRIDTSGSSFANCVSNTSTGMLYVAVTQAWVGAVGNGIYCTVGDTLFHIHELRLANNAYGISCSVNSTAIGTIDRIINDTGATGTTALNITSGGATIDLIAGKIHTDTAYYVAAGTLRLTCADITGARSGNATVSLHSAKQSANEIMAGPATGADALPDFRALVAADIPSLDTGKITSGALGLARGGTNADLSATGGANQVVKQASAGAALTVGALVAADIPSLDTGKITSGTLDAARGGTGVSNTGTITNADNTTITGGGTLALGGFTATIPATGTVPLGTGTNQQVTLWSGTNTQSGSANLTFTGSVLALTGSMTQTGTHKASTYTAEYSDTGTNDQLTMFLLRRNASGSPPTAGYGVDFLTTMQTDTTANRRAKLERATWVTVTDGSQKSRVQYYVYEGTTGRESLRLEAQTGAAAIGFLGAAAVTRPAVTLSRGGNAALASLLTALASLGLITDSTTA